MFDFSHLEEFKMKNKLIYNLQRTKMETTLQKGGLGQCETVHLTGFTTRFLMM